MMRLLLLLPQLLLLLLLFLLLLLWLLLLLLLKLLLIRLHFLKIRCWGRWGSIFLLLLGQHVEVVGRSWN